MNRRHFCKSGLLFVPSLFAILHELDVESQDGFLGQIIDSMAFTGQTITGTDFAVGTHGGFVFDIAVPINITALARWIHTGNGAVSENIYIFNNSHTQLASVSLTLNAFPAEAFAWVNLSPALTIPPGSNYFCYTDTADTQRWYDGPAGNGVVTTGRNTGVITRMRGGWDFNSSGTADDAVVVPVNFKYHV